jgi:hypothetical protein
MSVSAMYSPAQRSTESGHLVDIRSATLRLLMYCRANDWAGHDPYDALNSPVFGLRFINTRLPRLLITQALKRSPADLRSLLRVPRTQNPKALALFLAAAVKLSDIGLPSAAGVGGEMIDRLIVLRSQGTRAWCWGYSFPWQTRTTIVPRGAPNLVCTTFVANALLDAYEQGRDARCLDMAVSAAHYIANELYWTEGAAAGFSYPLATVRASIHNANFLGAALMCRVARYTGERALLEPALRVARHSVSRQHDDGSWDYGETAHQRWIDNFHTGYNLCALHAIGHDAETAEFESSVGRGMRFYRDHFFRADGAPRYFHDRTYPIDIHCVAQSIITLLALRELDPSNVNLANAVFRWAMAHMWDDRGFFYYRVLRLATIRTSYMRWSQAWMLLALASLLTTRATRHGG